MANLFSTVKVVRASEDVVEQIKEAIRSGALSTGSRLPPERELASTFGVSRVTIREALRILNGAGIISAKSGSAGGALVAEATKVVADSFATLLELRRATLQELSEARGIVEADIAELAALRADEADLAALEQSLEHARQSIVDNTPHMLVSVEFHTVLAKAAKNRVLLFTVESCRAPLNEALGGFMPTREMRLTTLDQHQKILEAVRRRDGAAARRLMEMHVDQFEARLQGVVEEKVTRGEATPELGPSHQ